MPRINELEDGSHTNVLPNGTIMHCDRLGRIHCNDGPAVIEPTGTRHWLQHGKIHREDGPALIDTDGRKIWYQNSELHRDDGPAVVRSDGSVEYWINNEEVNPFTRKHCGVQ